MIKQFFIYALLIVFYNTYSQSIVITSSNNFESTFQRVDSAYEYIKQNRSLITELSIRGNKEEIPNEFFKLPNIEILNINIENFNGNNLKLFNYPKIKQLTIKNVNLNNIPSIVYTYISIENLSITNCNLNNLSENIINLDSILYLNLSSNNIKEINFSIENLKLLKTIDLSFNELNKLPEGITKLKGIWNLNISFNKIILLPDSLDVHSAIYASNNEIVEFPLLGRNVHFIDLSYNKIESFPIERLHEISFRIDGNPLSKTMLEKLKKAGYI